MPNDAKLGLLVGVGLTIAVAVVFFSKDAPANQAESQQKTPPKSVTFQPQAAPDESMLGREPSRTGGQVTGWEPRK